MVISNYHVKHEPMGKCMANCFLIQTAEKSGGKTTRVWNICSLISSKRMRWPPVFFRAISGKSINKIRIVFWLGFYGLFFHKLRILLRYCPHKTLTFWNTNAKNTNIAPKWCRAFFIKCNTSKVIKP